jgi:hypothetical protein
VFLTPLDLFSNKKLFNWAIFGKFLTGLKLWLFLETQKLFLGGFGTGWKLFTFPKFSKGSRWQSPLDWLGSRHERKNGAKD